MRLLRGFFISLVIGLSASAAWAQFEKTPWPANVPTPSFEATDLQGKTWTNDSLKGRVVVLNFWATWCAPCKEELPTLQTLHELSDASQVLAINVREPAVRVARYVQSTGISFPVIADPKGELTQRWGVKAYPTTVLIAPNGQARWRVLGEVDWSSAQAQAWLDETQQSASTAKRSPGPKR